MSSIMEHYAAIVPFLGELLGEHCEVVLQDLSPDKNCIAAIANGHVSGRKLGAPLTDYALQMVTDGTWQETDYRSNYAGRTRDGQLLRSSTYFIKEDGILLGMLCINAETAHIQALSDAILKLGGLPLVQQAERVDIAAPQRVHMEPSETFYNSVEEITDAVCDEYFEGRDLPRDRMTQEERLAIVGRLEERGVFMLKGAVSSVSKSLACSEASVYRYLSIVHKMKKNDDLARASDSGMR